MHATRRDLITGLPLLATASWSWNAAEAAPGSLEADAKRAWLFGLPLVIMAQVRAEAAEAGAALNALRFEDDLVTPATMRITSPNVDTLYASAFLDLSDGPIELTVPDPGKRYMSVAVFDMYTTVDFVIGERTAGGPSGAWRLLAPHTVPHGPRDLQVSTPHAWVLARTLVEDPADLDAARDLQHRLRLEGPSVRPTAERFATRESPWTDYFRTVQALIDANPPKSTAGLDSFTRIRDAGRGKSFARDGYDDAALGAIDEGVARARSLVDSAERKGRFENGWSYPSLKVGSYGDDFVLRAIVAVSGLGALPPAEAMYMRASGDDGAGLFHGDGLWRLRMMTPIPVDGFWSMTMYEAKADGTFKLVPNALHRYAIGDRTPGLVRGDDGALDIWISREDPGGERTANWLPAPPQGPFSLTLRAYLPRRELVDGTFRLQPIERIGS